MLKMNRNRTLLLVGIIITSILFFSERTIKILFKDKVWAHRANSIEKYIEASSKFKGVELDVIFDDELNYFDVNHKPAISIHLSLLNYLMAEEIDSSFKFWIDFKNLTEQNQKQSFFRLDSIVQLMGLERNHFIIESKKPEYLSIFKEKGYKTSYYLPPGLHSLDSDSLNSVVEIIRKNIEWETTSYISADCKNYRILKRHFPEHKKLLWMLGKAKYYRRILLYNMLWDEKVDVVLITFNAKQGNR